MVGRICPPGWNRVKVSENLGATAVAPVAPVDTSLSTKIGRKIFGLTQKTLATASLDMMQICFRIFNTTRKCITLQMCEDDFSSECNRRTLKI